MNENKDRGEKCMNKKCQGAVSIFMIIVTLSCFMLGGIFIDATRIIAARNKVTKALDAATRSAMSYYDEDLVSEYGLYGVSNDELNEKFKKYFKTNMNKAEYEGINLFKYTIDDSKLSITANESFRDSMSRQILEYEKYRMPVTTTLALVDRLKGAFTKMNGSTSGLSKTADSAEGMEKAFNQASATIKSSGNAIKENIKKSFATSIKEGVTSILSSVAEAANTAGINQTIKENMTALRKEIEKMKQELQTLKKKRDELSENNNNLEQPSASANVDDGDPDAISEGKSSGEDYADTMQKINNEIADLEQEIAILEATVNNIENDLNRMKGELDILIANWKNAETALVVAEDELAAEEAELSRIKKDKNIAQKESLVANYNSIITSADNTINEIYAALQSDEVKDDYEYYKNALANNDTKKQDELLEKYRDDENIIALFGEYKAKYENEKKIAELHTQIAAASAEIQVQQNKVNSCKTKVQNCKDNIEACKQTIKNKSIEMQNKINELSDLATPDVKSTVVKTMKKAAKDVLEGDGAVGNIYDAITQITLTMPGTDEEYDTSTEKGLIKMFKDIFEEFQNLYTVITNADKFVDQAMYIDYIMGKCTYLTSQSAKDHYFKYGEVEYILFNNESQLINITSTIAAIYGIRFAINFVNYAITTQGDFFVRIATAAARSMYQSAADLYDMIVVPAGAEEAPGCYICPSAEKWKLGGGLKLTYSDHLRLLLLMKFTEDDMTELQNTIDATLQKKADKDTSSLYATRELYSSAKAEVKVGVNLIMIPMFTDMLPIDDYFNNGQFIIKQTTSFSY